MTPMKNLARLSFLTVLIISACQITGGYRFNTGSLPETPVNLSDFNTEYDDYNSTAPTLGELIPFCFSTNRRSQGGEFDIIYKPMNVNFDKSTGDLKITDQYDNWLSIADNYYVLQNNINKINTSGNEFGPNLVIDLDFNTYYFTLLYSTDVSGNAQINFISNQTDSLFSEPKEVDFLNSEYEDLYPTLSSDKSEIYFCSDRDGNNFNFYYTQISHEGNLEAILSDSSSHEIVLHNTLSSDFDDKCPFILEDTMVFASNRNGGFGGYDLYYSNLVNGEWNEPINFGADINSESDEFRPILINEGVSNDQTMMVFSSNRSGGIGGFDLYFVGVPND